MQQVIDSLYIGGILTHKRKVKFQELFNSDELITKNGMFNRQILDLKDDLNKINKISKKGRDKYFKIFNNSIVADSITSECLETSPYIIMYEIIKLFVLLEKIIAIEIKKLKTIKIII